jgi:hypothetical protein
MDKSIVFRFQSIRYFLAKWLTQHRVDSSITLILAIGFAVVTYLSAQKIPPPILTDFYAQDVWFGSDIPTVFGNITSLQSDFGRNNKHPLFPLFVFPLIFGLGKVLHLDLVSAARLVTALVAGIWIGSLYVLFRQMRPRLDAIIFSLLGGVTAAAAFWFVVPESFSFGSLSMLLGLVLVAVAQHHKLSPVWYVAVSAFTVSITITNWMVGLLATFVNFRWKKALQITGITFLVVNLLWMIQRTVFRNSGYPFSLKTFIGEKKFITAPESDSVLGAIASFAYKTIVMPAIQLSDSAIRPGWPKLTANPLALGSGGFWGIIAILSWTALLALGIWGFFSTKQHPKLRIVLGLTILGQLFLHSIYGTAETFIYSLHFAPLLVALAAFSTLTRWRWVGLALAGLLVVSAGIHNRSQFNQLTAALQTYGTPQQQVQSQMRTRPADPWLRNAGHIILATPGSRAEEKAYYEPGGSFSPVAGSFGVSIWMVDKDGNLKATSDSIPLDKIGQQFTDLSRKQPPGLLAKTEFYQAAWSQTKPGTWQLTLNTPANSTTRPVLMIRSVGPAGGAVNSLNWNGQRLLINDRWSLKPSATPVKVHLGSETLPGWIKESSSSTEWKDQRGWGYGRLELTPGQTWNIELANFTPAPTNLNPAKISSDLVLQLPDSQFAESLNAQVTHLLMGLVGNRTRPGDPLNYSLPYLREGAYQMVALARAGQLDVAKQLSGYFAETDFINGIHPEAEIPALGIWALTAVAEQLNQPEYDRSLWPSIQRKAELIVDMLSTNRPGYPVVEQSQVPFSEYPDFLKMDLIAGKMDNVPGLITLDPSASIMSYRALLDAAALAARVNQPAAAKRWRSEAERLQAAWGKAFERTFADKLETYTRSLWPSGIAAGNQKEVTQGLERRWSEAHDANGALRQPVVPHLNLAETHQWLLLGESDRVWNTLKWFWQHQASPGLYTWWTDNPKPGDAPRSFSQWQWFRGWVNPPHVTPHYWTTAEMLLLQLDMLAYVNQAASEPTLVIGAGKRAISGWQLSGLGLGWQANECTNSREKDDRKTWVCFPCQYPCKHAYPERSNTSNGKNLKNRRGT